MQDVAARLSRRSLLKTGLVGALLVGAGSVGLALEQTVSRATPPELAVLDATEYAVLSAIAARICPPGGPGAPGATALGVAGSIDALLARLDGETQRGLKIALRVFDNALTGALFGERLVPFTKLSDDAQDGVLERWRESRIGFRRTVFKSLCALISAVYWGDPRTWERIGYGGPPDVAALRQTYRDNLVDLDALRANTDANKGS